MLARLVPELLGAHPLVKRCRVAGPLVVAELVSRERGE